MDRPLANLRKSSQGNIRYKSVSLLYTSVTYMTRTTKTLIKRRTKKTSFFNLWNKNRVSSIDFHIITAVEYKINRHDEYFFNLKNINFRQLLVDTDLLSTLQHQFEVFVQSIHLVKTSCFTFKLTRKIIIRVTTSTICELHTFITNIRICWDSGQATTS